MLQTPLVMLFIQNKKVVAHKSDNSNVTYIPRNI